MQYPPMILNPEIMTQSNSNSKSTFFLPCNIKNSFPRNIEKVFACDFIHKQFVCLFMNPFYVREAANKKFFFSGPATKAFTPPPPSA